MSETAGSPGRRPPRPPCAPGAAELRRGDTLRLLWWMELGFVHGASRGPLPGRLFPGVMAIAWWPTVPVLLLGQTAAVRRSSVRYYMSTQRDAVLAVVARDDGWHVGEHLSARPGTGRGRALRAVVAPQLLARADNLGVTIHGTAATRRLAQQYLDELPETVDVGRGQWRGRRLQRTPAT